MRSLTDLLHPFSLEAFHADHDDRAPLHVPADAGRAKADLLSWARFNQLLDQRSIWTAQTLKVVFGGNPVPPHQYCSEVRVRGVRALRPDPAKVQILAAQGASLIADDAQFLHGPIRALVEPLSRAFAGAVDANIYCSFGGVQAFGTHYDAHHVFAVQTEGEKVWRLYENRAEAPESFPADSPDLRRRIADARGPVMREVTMRAGDVLYLPRGWYHDALASSEASLHVTFSVTPLTGRAVLRSLDDLIGADPACRAWLPPAGRDGGEALKAHLADLAERLAALVKGEAVAADLAKAQARLVPRGGDYALPVRPTLTFLEPTGVPMPRVGGAGDEVLAWAATQRRMALEDMLAQFDFIAPETVTAAVEAAERAGALLRQA